MHGILGSSMNKKVVIIHGTKGSPCGNWFPWLAAELRGRGAEVLVPRFPTPDEQALDTWLETFAREAGTVDSNTTIIGHSLGSVFLLRLLEKMQGPIGSSVFVAGFTSRLGIPEFDELNSSFILPEYNWSSIRRNAGKIFCFSGQDDPYVPISQGLELAAGLCVEPILIAGGGHLNAESGYLEFPLLLEKLK